MKPRTRTTYKPSLVGSSDIRRVRIAERTRQEVHNKNVNFYQNVLKDAKVTPESTITEEYLSRVYKEIKVCGQWSRISKYTGKLVFMYKDGYKMR